MWRRVFGSLNPKESFNAAILVIVSCYMGLMHFKRNALDVHRISH